MPDASTMDPVAVSQRVEKLWSLAMQGQAASIEDTYFLASTLRTALADTQSSQRALAKEEQASGHLVDERDAREEQITEIYHALGGTDEWSNLHDLGVDALELARDALADTRRLEHLFAQGYLCVGEGRRGFFDVHTLDELRDMIDREHEGGSDAAMAATPREG